MRSFLNLFHFYSRIKNFLKMLFWSFALNKGKFEKNTTNTKLLKHEFNYSGWAVSISFFGQRKSIDWHFIRSQNQQNIIINKWFLIAANFKTMTASLLQSQSKALIPRTKYSLTKSPAKSNALGHFKFHRIKIVPNKTLWMWWTLCFNSQLYPA